MTCGAKACQRSRHANKCKEWHAHNAAAAAHHYADVVKEYRRRHPTYQRRRRLVAALREIREQMVAAVAGAGARLAGLVERGKRVLQDGRREPAQVRATTGKPLECALDAAGSMMGAVDELVRLSGALAELGGTP